MCMCVSKVVVGKNSWNIRDKEKFDWNWNPVQGLLGIFWELWHETKSALIYLYSTAANPTEEKAN